MRPPNRRVSIALTVAASLASLVVWGQQTKPVVGDGGVAVTENTLEPAKTRESPGFGVVQSSDEHGYRS